MLQRALTPAGFLLCLSIGIEEREVPQSYSEGLVLKRSFEYELEIQLDEYETEDVEEESRIAAESEEYSLTCEVMDEYTEVIRGVEMGLERTYESLAMDAEYRLEWLDGTEDVFEGECASPIEGAEVAFIRETDGLYIDVEDLSEEEVDLYFLLNGDLSFGWLLPDGKVAPGDSWEAPTKLVAELLDPLGDLYWFEETETYLPEALFLYEASLEGSIEVTLDRIEEVEGEELAILVLAVDVTASDAYAEEFPPNEYGYAELAWTEDYEISGKGELRWNLSAKRLASIQVDVDFSMDDETTWIYSDESSETERTLDVGNVRWSQRVEEG